MTVTWLEVLVLPASSVAVAVIAWLPLPTVVESQVTLQGLCVAVPTGAPSTENLTCET